MTRNKLEIVAEPGKPVLESRYVVDAPRSLVFEVFTKPEHLKRWWGPRSLTLISCDCDFRVGGHYRFVQQAPDGRTFAFSGEYKEIVPNERFVCTFVFEGMAGADAVQTISFEEKNGQTTIVSNSVYRSVAARDGHIANGMEEGMVETYERLDELLASLRKP
jgi:uncharacterized protein YndB with AHSA1/START domain